MKQKLFWGILAVGYLLLCINSVNIGGDFDVYLHAAEKLSRGENIYDPPFLNGLKYYYSPFFALALTPFCQQPFAIELFWLILLGGMMLRVWQLIKYQFDTNIFSQRTLYLWTLLSFFFALRFWLYNVAMIQVTIFLLWAMMESVHQLNKGRNIQAAGLLALAINVKILPIVLLPYWLYRGRVKAVGWLCGFSMLLLYLPSLFLGQEQNAFLLAEWWEVINPMNGEHLIETETNAQSLVGLIPAYFMEMEGEFPFKRNWLNLSVAQVHQLTNLIRLLLIALSLWFLGRPFQKPRSSLAEFRALAYMLMIVPLIFPHQQKYAFLFAYPMIAYLCYYCVLKWTHKRDRPFLLFGSALALCLLVFSPLVGADIIGRYAYDLIHYFRLLSIATLGLVVLALLARPKHIEGIIAKL